MKNEIEYEIYFCRNCGIRDTWPTHYELDPDHYLCPYCLTLIGGAQDLAIRPGQMKK
jgi:hypothetical protein